MKKAALLLGTLALIFPASVRSEVPSIDPKFIFEVSLVDPFPIKLSPRIHFLAPKNKDQVICFDCMPDLRPALFTFSLDQDDWKLIPICDQPSMTVFY
jgi:hypothetical protein